MADGATASGGPHDVQVGIEHRQAARLLDVDAHVTGGASSCAARSSARL